MSPLRAQYNVLLSYLSNFFLPQSSPKLVKRRTKGSNVKTGLRRPVTSDSNQYEFIPDFHKDERRPVTSGSQYCNHQSSDYHIVFGPASLRSSVDGKLS